MYISAEKLITAMKNSSINSISKLSALAGVHRNTLYPIVNKAVSPFSQSYLAICKTLEVSPVTLLEDEALQDISHIRKIISELLSTNEQRSTYACFLYGSRAKNRGRKYSDYDLGITAGENKIRWRDFLRLKDDLERLVDDLPVKVSLLNFDDAPESFLIDFDEAMIFVAGKRESFYYFKGMLNGKYGKKKAA